MTVVLGLQTLDGALLIADCLATNGEETNPKLKIVFGGYTCEEEETSTIKLSGVYSGSSGHFFMVDVGGLSIHQFSKAPNRADLLTDPFILQTDADSFDRQIALLEQSLRDCFTVEQSQRVKKRRQLEQELDAMMFKREIRSLLDSTIQSPAYGITRLVLRISDNYKPDMLQITNGEVSCVELYGEIGSGRKIAQPLLQEKYHSLKTLEEAFPIAIDVFNTVLQNKDQFRGYQLVTVKYNTDLTTIIKTAKDSSAQRITLDAITYLDPWFCKM